MRAYSYRSGEIGFTTGPIPAGTLFLAQGANLDFIKGLARRAYDNETYLVPGVPEAADDDAALEAYSVFFDRVQRMQKGSP
jgi:hypothetical protein